MRGEQAIFNLGIKKKIGLSLNPDIHNSKVFSSEVPSSGHFPVSEAMGKMKTSSTLY